MLPVAVQRRTAVAVSPADDWLVASTVDNKVRAIDVDAPRRKTWTDYLVGRRPRAAYDRRGPGRRSRRRRLQRPDRRGALVLRGAHRGGGQGAQPARGPAPHAGQVADVAYRAEHDQVGVRCGRMDQTIAALAEPGTALLLETGTGAMMRVTFPGRLWVVETGVSHTAGGWRVQPAADGVRGGAGAVPETATRSRPPGGARPRRSCGDDAAGCRKELAPRVRHVVTETARTRAGGRGPARRASLRRLGRLLVEGHESLRKDYQSTVPEADFLVESAVARGAYGARLTGAGWGGAVLVLAPAEREGKILGEVVRRLSGPIRTGAGDVEHPHLLRRPPRVDARLSEWCPLRRRSIHRWLKIGSRTSLDHMNTRFAP